MPLRPSFKLFPMTILIFFLFRWMAANARVSWSSPWLYQTKLGSLMCPSVSKHAGTWHQHCMMHIIPCLLVTKLGCDSREYSKQHWDHVWNRQWQGHQEVGESCVHTLHYSPPKQHFWKQGYYSTILCAYYLMTSHAPLMSLGSLSLVLMASFNCSAAI